MTAADTSTLPASAPARLAVRLKALLDARERHEPAALRALAELRRAKRGTLDDSGVATRCLYSLLGETTPSSRSGSIATRQLEDLMLVAWLFATANGTVVVRVGDERRRPGGFGADLRIGLIGADGQRSNGADRLMRALLIAPRSDVPRHLQRAFALLGGQAGGGAERRRLTVDAAQLVRDLGSWDRPPAHQRGPAAVQSRANRTVQRDWAHGFWGYHAPPSDAKASDDTTDHTTIEGDR